MRFARRERITNASLKQAIERADGGLIKQRIPRPGQGRSGGFRVIVAYRAQGRAVFLFGFAKNERENIDPDELQLFRILGANWLAADAATITRAIEVEDLEEISHDDEEA